MFAKSGTTVAPATSSTRVSRSASRPELVSLASGATVAVCPASTTTWSAFVTGRVEPSGRTSKRTMPAVSFVPSETTISTSLRPWVAAEGPVGDAAVGGEVGLVALGGHDGLQEDVVAVRVDPVGQHVVRHDAAGLDRDVRDAVLLRPGVLVPPVHVEAHDSGVGAASAVVDLVGEGVAAVGVLGHRDLQGRAVVDRLHAFRAPGRRRAGSRSERRRRHRCRCRAPAAPSCGPGARRSRRRSRSGRCSPRRAPGASSRRSPRWSRRPPPPRPPAG